MEKLSIRTFGTFSISCGSITVSESDNRTRKIWRLVKYLAANRHRRVPHGELCEIIGCADNTDSCASLKTMLHRARNTLERLSPECRNLIILKNGSYYWNRDIPQVLDEDLFALGFEKAITANVSVDNLEASLDTLALYRGYYLDRAFDDIPATAERIHRYHKMAVKLFEFVAEQLTQNGDFTRLHSLAVAAIETDPYHEAFHYHLIRSCIELSLHDEALVYYKRVNDLFMGKFRVNPSDRIRALRRFIVKDKLLTESNLERIGEELLSTPTDDSPTYCEYDSFRLICNVMNNTVPRHYRSDMSLVLFTVEFTDTSDRPSEARLRQVMKSLQMAIHAELFATDVFTRYSIAQFLALVNVKKPCRIESLTENVHRSFGAAVAELPLKLTISFQAKDQI